MKARSESILFLIVGSIAAIGGAYNLFYGSYQESSVWLIILNDILLIVGISVAIAGARGIFTK